MAYEKKQYKNFFLRKSTYQLIIKICSVLFMLLFTNQCANTNRALMNDYLFSATYYEYGSLRPYEFQNEIERLQKSIQEMPDTPDAAKAHIQLAFLYSHYRNPAPDYSRALQQLETYVLSDTKGGRQDYVQNWLRMLKEISAAAVANEDLNGKMEQMKKDTARLEKENAEMKEKLEKLKHLDIELEQKRKLVK